MLVPSGFLGQIFSARGIVEKSVLGGARNVKPELILKTSRKFGWRKPEKG